MATIDDVFPELLALIRERTDAHGFTLADEQAGPALLGSRRARLRKGIKELHLVWDGKEQWLVVEYRPAPEYPPAREWTGLLSERYTGDNISDDDRERLRRGVTGVLDSLWPAAPA